MSIYTKTGDTGTTATFGGKRIAKYDPQIEACGALDEASSFIGWVISSLSDSTDITLLSSIQEDLYSIMAYIADGPLKEAALRKKLSHFENYIDKLEESLPKLTRFVLPQGTESTSRFHVTRTMVRSAERRVVAYLASRDTTKQDSIIMQYLNRLSDVLFILARRYSEKEVLT